jgi:signal transduction histidine kinase
MTRCFSDTSEYAFRSPLRVIFCSQTKHRPYLCNLRFCWHRSRSFREKTQPREEAESLMPASLPSLYPPPPVSGGAIKSGHEEIPTEMSSGHLLLLLNDILDSAKLDQGQLQLEAGEVHLDFEAENVVSMLQHSAADRGVELRVETADGVPRCVQG